MLMLFGVWSNFCQNHKWLGELIFNFFQNIIKPNSDFCFFWLKLRTPNEAFFPLKFRTFGLEQTNWADKFWGILGIFGQAISTHFGTVRPLSIFSITLPLFLQKPKPLYPHPKYLFEIWIWIWVAKNWEFSLRVSVVRPKEHHPSRCLCSSD